MDQYHNINTPSKNASMPPKDVDSTMKGFWMHTASRPNPRMKHR